MVGCGKQGVVRGLRPQTPQVSSRVWQGVHSLDQQGSSRVWQRVQTLDKQGGAVGCGRSSEPRPPGDGKVWQGVETLDPLGCQGVVGVQILDIPSCGQQGMVWGSDPRPHGVLGGSDLYPPPGATHTPLGVAGIPEGTGGCTPTVYPTSLPPTTSHLLHLPRPSPPQQFSYLPYSALVFDYARFITHLAQSCLFLFAFYAR